MKLRIVNLALRRKSKYVIKLSTELRRKLLGKGQELTFSVKQKVARSLELSQTQAKQIEGDAGATISAIKEDNKPKGN